jgi:hypothetical protein
MRLGEDKRHAPPRFVTLPLSGEAGAADAGDVDSQLDDEQESASKLLLLDRSGIPRSLVLMGRSQARWTNLRSGRHTTRAATPALL